MIGHPSLNGHAHHPECLYMSIQGLALGVFQVIYGFIFRTQTLAAKQDRVGFSINVDDITWDGEGILRRWPGYVNFSKVIFGGCN